DPRRNLVRPADPLRLLLVLAEVARGMDELLRNDRRAQRDVGECGLVPRSGGATAFEVLPHRGNVQLDDRLATKLSNLSLVVGYELHVGRPFSQSTTSCAFRS